MICDAVSKNGNPLKRRQCNEASHPRTMHMNRNVHYMPLHVPDALTPLHVQH